MAERETAKDMVVRYSPGSSLDLQFGVPLRTAERLLTSIPWGYAHGRSTGRLATPCGPGSNSIRFPMIVDERDPGFPTVELNLSGTAFLQHTICCGLISGGPKECDHFSIKDANSCKMACAM